MNKENDFSCFFQEFLKKVFIILFRVEQQQTSLTKISEQIDTLKKRQKAKLAELETQLKQEKLAHDQSRKDVKNLKARNKENDDYLKKEAVKRNEIQRKLSTLQKKYEELNEKYSLKTKQLEGETKNLWNS